MRALLLLSAPLLFSQQAAQQAAQPAAQEPVQEDAVFKAGVALVRVDAQVVDGPRVIPDLDRADFIITDEGQPRRVEYFAREAEPLWLVLLLDVSGSMVKHIAEMARVSQQALTKLGPDDRVAVMPFGRNSKVEQDFTASREDASGAIRRAAADRSMAAGSAINVGVMEAAAHVRAKAEGKPGRRAVVILTDNGGLNYQSNDQQALAALFGADTVLNAIVTDKAKEPAIAAGRDPVFTPANVFHLARESGGEVLRAEKRDTFPLMIERIRTRYSLHYQPPADAKSGVARRIRVDLTPEGRRRYPKAEVRARSGYSMR